MATSRYCSVRHRSCFREAHNQVSISAPLVATAYMKCRFVDFSLNRVRMLIHFGVIPYLVFDGDYLPSKAATEAERAARRAESKRIGLELYRLGKISQAHKELQKAVDVTPEMAGQLIVELRKLGVQYVVAPYEADAQLAYLERKGLIHSILSEDSDLLVFGAKSLLTKLDRYGECIEINRNDFTACREISLVGWSDAEFRVMAILSGCDYLPSINNMGLMTAYRLVRKYKTVEKILRMLEFDGKYNVPAGYLEAFRRAEGTFLCQRVYCPISKDLSMAAGDGANVEIDDMAFIGVRIEKEMAMKVANGDLHPITKQPLRIPGLFATSPRTPLGNALRRDAVKFTDMKENKSIESFFKAKRTALAELDPNSFAMSPSQQRLQERASGTWMSNPAPARPPLPESSASTHATESYVTNSIENRQVSALTRLHQPKRKRLCSDLADDQDSLLPLASSQGTPSKFFVCDQPEPTMRAAKMMSKKVAAAKFDLWSDDSIEDVMVGLPDVAAHGKFSAKPEKMFVQQDSERPQVEEPLAYPSVQKQVEDCLLTSACHENSAQDSQSSISSNSTDSSDASSGTSATSVSSSTQAVLRTMDDHVAAELTMLRQRCSYAPKPMSTPQQRIPDDHKIKPGEYRRALEASEKPRLSRHGSSTPLQRLGASALNRSQSRSSFTRHIPKQAVETSHRNSLDRERSPKPTPPSNAKCYIPPREPNHVSTTVPEFPTIKGSEDLIIPDSEEEASDACSGSDLEKPRKPTINLGRFAFSG